MTLLIGIQYSGLALNIGSMICESRLMHNLPNHPRQYGKRQTRAEEGQKCLDKVLETTYHFSIFSPDCTANASHI